MCGPHFPSILANIIRMPIYFGRITAASMRKIEKEDNDMVRSRRARHFLSLLAALAVAGCGGGGGGGDSTAGSYGFPQVTQDEKAAITVWVDADRTKAA